MRRYDSNLENAVLPTAAQAGDGGSGGAGGQVKLEENIGDVPLHGVLADRQPLGDRSVAQSIGHEHDHLSLPRAEQLEVGRGNTLRRLDHSIMLGRTYPNRSFETFDDLRPPFLELKPRACNEINDYAGREHFACSSTRANAFSCMDRQPRDSVLVQLDLTGMHAGGKDQGGAHSPLR